MYVYIHIYGRKCQIHDGHDGTGMTPHRGFENRDKIDERNDVKL